MTPRLAWTCAGALLLLATACAPRTAGRYDREQLAARLTEPDGDAGLRVGDFRLASPSVVDGDTIKVVGIEGTLRLLAIDTEETFKSDKDRRAYDEGLEAYLAKKQAGKERPIKAATPLGMDAKHWAEEFFEGVREVRLERDHPKELRGRYGRLLAYVMVEKDGEWLNYNVECVRAGMSPYFTKYGYSRRFHDQFVEAQDEARRAGLGIWDPEGEHYQDYDLRLRWWDARADVIQRFERESQDQENFVTLTNWDSIDRLEALEGEEVVVLATVGDVRPREGKKPARVMLSRRMFSDLPLVFFDDEVLARSNVQAARGEFVRVTGTVSRYVFRSRRGRKRAGRGKGKGEGEGEGEEPPSQLQIRIRKAEQITFVDTRPGHIAGGFAPLMPEDPRAEPEPESEPEQSTEPAPPAGTDEPAAPALPAPPDAATAPDDATAPADSALPPPATTDDSSSEAVPNP